MKESIRSFQDLVVWQKAHRLVLKIYEITKEYPSEEKFGLISQMRRASISVPANIAEGFKKRGRKTTFSLAGEAPWLAYIDSGKTQGVG